MTNVIVQDVGADKHAITSYGRQRIWQAELGSRFPEHRWQTSRNGHGRILLRTSRALSSVASDVQHVLNPWRHPVLQLLLWKG